jgi:hypothetical protein
MRRYAGQNEVRFKTTDKQKEMYRETALFLYENNLMEKPSIHSFGRWCMDHVCKEYRLSVIESNIIRQQERRQKGTQYVLPSPVPPSLADYQAYLSHDQGP